MTKYLRGFSLKIEPIILDDRVETGHVAQPREITLDTTVEGGADAVHVVRKYFEAFDVVSG